MTAHIRAHHVLTDADLASMQPRVSDDPFGWVDDNRGAAMLGVASIALIFVMGWVAGLLTVLWSL